MIRPSLGGTAKVIKSSGFHSNKYIGEEGYAIMCLPCPTGKCWVLRFASILPYIEEGLFEGNEIVWIR